MALEIRRTIPDAHDQAILCIAYNPQRRELFSGSQDSTIKVWQSETGELIRTINEHAGWVTGLAFSTELRTLFSCSIDGRIIVYSFKGEPIQRERAGGRDPNGGEASRSSSGPLYCMAWDSRRQNLVVGGNGQLLIYSAVADAHAAIGSSTSANVLKLHSVLRAHCTTQGSVVKEEPVRGIIATDSGKLYTVGYDRTFCIWDTDHQSKISLAGEATRGKKKGGEGLREATLKRSWPPEKDQGRPCHDGAISCATFDPDNNWLITGSFDRTVKIWAGDGKKPIAEISNFSDTITGLVYVPATKTLWISFNSPHPLVYDPRSATDITQYLQQSSASAKQLKEAKERIQRLFRIAETGEVVACTNSRQLQILRYNPHSASAILRAHTDWVEVLAYCYKQGADSDGAPAAKAAEAEMTLLSAGADCLVRRWEPASRMNLALYQHTDAFAGHKGAVLCAIYCADLDLFATGGDDGTVRLWPQREHHSLRLPRGSALGASDDEFDDFDFEESMGLGMDEPSREPSGPDLLSGWAEAEQGTHKVLSEHTDRVTGLACEGCHLVSVSWDLSMRVWNLASERGASSHVVDNAHDDYLLSVTFSPEQGQIASSSADQGVKLWDWNADVNASEAEAQGLCIPDGKKGKRLCGILSAGVDADGTVKPAHDGDVSHVKWNKVHLNSSTAIITTTLTIFDLEQVHSQWVTGSEDHTVRLWSPAGDLVGEISPPGDAITALAIDHVHGYVLVASMDRAMRVYDPTTREVIQQHHGHSDAVRCILHVPEKCQYITAAWDHTLRVWRAPAPPGGRRGVVSHDADGGSNGRGGGSAEEEEEEVPKTFAELHPFREPKWLAERDKRGGADKSFFKKVSADDPKERRKKKATDDDSAKSVTGLSLKINELEASLRNHYDRTAPAAEASRRQGRAAGANRGSLVERSGRGGGVRVPRVAPTKARAAEPPARPGPVGGAAR